MQEPVAFLVGILIQGCFVYLAGRLAAHRNRSSMAWMWVTVILGPISLIVLAVLPRNKEEILPPEPAAKIEPYIFDSASSDAGSLHWYYATKDGHIGPTTVKTIRDLLQRGTVTQDTMVWNERFGELWKPLRDTEIAEGTMHVPLPVRSIPPPVREGPPQKKRRRWLGPVIAAVVLFWLFGGVIWILNLLGYDTETLLSNSIPKCDSITAKDMAKEALQNAPLAKVINITVYEIRDAKQVSYDYATGKRTCQATALLNSGRHEVSYTIEWINKDERKYWLEIQESPF